MSADALSDVLRTVRLTGATFFDVVATAPWVAEQPPREKILPKILPGAGHLIAYHVVTEGRCFTNLIGEEPIAVEAILDAVTRGLEVSIDQGLKIEIEGLQRVNKTKDAREGMAAFVEKREPNFIGD